jgi:type 1 glutamine amidotransferase
LANAADDQECHHGRCRSSAVQSASLTTETASATEDVTSVPVETVVGDEEDPEETDASTTVVPADPTSPTEDEPASSVATAVNSAVGPATSGGGGGDHWTPSMSDTFVVDLENRPIPSNAASVYVVDLAHTEEQM